jgi:hypothetical protein
MRQYDFDELLVDAGADVSYPSDKFEAWEERRGIDSGEAYLAGCMFPNRTVFVGAYDFITEAAVIRINSAKEGIPQALDDGLLIIATCLNGDLLAVDLRDKKGVVGIIDHERVWDDIPVRDIFVPVARSIEELTRVMFSGKAPGDFYEAQRAAKRRRRPRKNRKGPGRGGKRGKA